VKNKFNKNWGWVVGLVLVVGIVGATGYVLGEKQNISGEGIKQETSQENKYLKFWTEVEEVTRKNYWNNLGDEEWNKLVTSLIEKITGRAVPASGEGKEATKKVIRETLDLYEDEAKKKEFVTTLADSVLASLEPANRSRLYLKKDEKALADNVNNKTENNYYKDLGVAKEAKPQEVKSAYEKLEKELAPKSDTASKEKLEAAKRAVEVLGDEGNRQRYDTYSLDPTIVSRELEGGVLYLKWSKFSPNSFNELVAVTEKYKGKKGLNGLIVDLRDNVGGAIDGLSYFLGPFVGNDTLGYQFFLKGKKEDYLTKTGWLPGLVQYKKVVVLINGQTQSTAEVMAGAIKKFNAGILVGTKSKGWGTVERVFSLKNQLAENEIYSIFLVHRLTLRDDGQPIEGRGVEPVVNITSPSWESELGQYYEGRVMVEAVKSVL